TGGCGSTIQAAATATWPGARRCGSIQSDGVPSPSGRGLGRGRSTSQPKIHFSRSERRSPPAVFYARYLCGDIVSLRGIIVRTLRTVMLVIVGCIVVVGCVLAGFVWSGGAIGALIHPAEILVIGGAALGALLVMSPKKVLIDLVK